MGKCLYSHEDGAYCDKHDHGAVTVGCCGEENCPDRKVWTNYDRMHNANIDQLAETLMRFIWWNPEKDVVIEWLNKEVDG